MNIRFIAAITTLTLASAFWCASWSVPRRPPSAAPLNGTYTVSRDTVFVRETSDGTIIPAVITGATLSASIDGVTFTFLRQ